MSSTDLALYVKRGGIFKGQNLLENKNFHLIKRGDYVYVEIGDLQYFVDNLFYLIPCEFVLLTGGWQNKVWENPYSWNGPLVPEKLREVIEDRKVIAWIAKSPLYPLHPKCLPVPIGANPDQKVEQQKVWMSYQNNRNIRKSNVITCLPCRKNGLFRDNYPKLEETIMSPEEYFTALLHSSATLSPTGHRSDCQRHLESIGLGCMPVINDDLSIGNITHLDKDISFRESLVPIYGESNIKFIKQDHLEHVIDKPHMYGKPNSDLILVEYWKRKIKQKVISLLR